MRKIKLFIIIFSFSLLTNNVFCDEDITQKELGDKTIVKQFDISKVLNDGNKISLIVTKQSSPFESKTSKTRKYLSFKIVEKNREEILLPMPSRSHWNSYCNKVTDVVVDDIDSDGNEDIIIIGECLTPKESVKTAIVYFNRNHLYSNDSCVDDTLEYIDLSHNVSRLAKNAWLKCNNSSK
jgi:hypothetical protein